jgi:hypothetical protein
MPWAEEEVKRKAKEEKERFEPITVLPCGIDPNQKSHNPNHQTQVSPNPNIPNPDFHSEELVMPANQEI